MDRTTIADIDWFFTYELISVPPNHALGRMPTHVRIVGGLWIIAGVVAFGCALWWLGVAIQTLSIPPEYLVLLVYGICGAIGGLFLTNGERLGRYLVLFVAF